MMRRLKFIIATFSIINCVFLLYSPILAEEQITQRTARELFASANQLYQQGKFDEAAELYKRLLQAGYTEAIVWYNLGNTYVKLGKLGNAIAAYERARRLNPREKDLLENLKQISPPENEPRPFILLLPFFFILDFFTLNELFILGEIFYVLSCLVAIIAILNSPQRLVSLSRLLIKPLLVLFVLTLVFFAFKYHRELITQYGIVTKDKTIAHSGPGTEFTEIMILPEGTKFKFLGKSQTDWARIKTLDGKSGYIALENFELI